MAAIETRESIHFTPQQDHKRSVFTVLFIDVITSILLAIFWNVTVNINGHSWHLPLILLAFVGGVSLRLRLHFKSRMFFPVQLAAPACVTRHFPGDGLHVHGHVLSNDGIVVLSRLMLASARAAHACPVSPHAHLPVAFPSNLVCFSVHHKP
jgi:uncharacterized integral membrane protein